jgi:DNA-binding NarL/FixJ family response regulator
MPGAQIKTLSCPGCGCQLSLKLHQPAPVAGPVAGATRLGRYGFTQREMQVIGMVLEGLRYREIAEALGTTTQTVKNCVSAIYDKVGCSNKAELFNMVLLGGRSEG